MLSRTIASATAPVAWQYSPRSAAGVTSTSDDRRDLPTPANQRFVKSPTAQRRTRPPHKIHVRCNSVPFNGGMCSRHPTTVHGTDSGILGENFRESVRELAAHCSNSNVVFGAHGSPSTLTGPAIWPMPNVKMKSHRKGQLFDPDQIALAKRLPTLRQTGDGGKRRAVNAAPHARPATANL